MTRRNCLVASLLTLVMASGVLAQLNGDVIVSEIMYNPASSEGTPNAVEWLEIYNTGTSTIDVSGWFLQDEDGATGGIPAGTTVGPFEAVVLIPDIMTLAEFQVAWGSGYQVVQVSSWEFGAGGLENLSNSPSSTNEVLTLRNGSGVIEDTANYDDAPPWPADPGGPSIYLIDGALDAVSNDSGASWAAASNGVDGAFVNAFTGNFDGIDTGSPGFVADSSATLPFGIAITQPVACDDITFTVSGATPGAEIYNLIALECSSPAGSGPLFGLSIAPAAGAVFTQLANPLGSDPFHVLADASGDYLYLLPLSGACGGVNLGIEAVSLELTLGFVTGVSSTTGCVAISF